MTTLNLNPVSVAGYLLKGRYPERVGDRTGAMAANARGLQLQKAGRDVLFLWNHRLE